MSVRVLHLTFDMRIGGTEQVIRNLILASDPKQFAMSVFCLESPVGPFGELLRDAGVPVCSVQRRPGFDWAVLRALRSHLQRERIEVLHCHQYTPWAYGVLASRGLGLRLVFTEHGRFYPDVRSPKRRFINPLLARATQQLTAISEATRQALIDYEYLPASRIGVVYNGIEGLSVPPEVAAQARAQYGIPAQAPVLGTIARFDPIKNHPMLLRAFRAVLDAQPDSWLLMVGDGEERAAVEQLRAELGLEERVVLSGYVTEPAALLAAMDVFALPSLSEGTSMTLLEAMSLGKPCVVTDVGGNPEIVADGSTGYVTPTEQPAPFAAAVLALFNDAQQRSAMATAARARFEQRFSSAQMAQAYARMYRGDT